MYAIHIHATRDSDARDYQTQATEQQAVAFRVLIAVGGWVTQRNVISVDMRATIGVRETDGMDRPPRSLLAPRGSAHQLAFLPLGSEPLKARGPQRH